LGHEQHPQRTRVAHDLGVLGDGDAAGGPFHARTCGFDAVGIHSVGLPRENGWIERPPAQVRGIGGTTAACSTVVAVATLAAERALGNPPRGGPAAPAPATAGRNPSVTRSRRGRRAGSPAPSSRPGPRSTPPA